MSNPISSFTQTFTTRFSLNPSSIPIPTPTAAATMNPNLPPNPHFDHVGYRAYAASHGHGPHPSYHWGRMGRWRRGPSRLVWFVLGAGSATLFMRHKLNSHIEQGGHGYWNSFCLDSPNQPRRRIDFEYTNPPIPPVQAQTLAPVQPQPQPQLQAQAQAQQQQQQERGWERGWHHHRRSTSPSNPNGGDQQPKEWEEDIRDRGRRWAHGGWRMRRAPVVEQEAVPQAPVAAVAPVAAQVVTPTPAISTPAQPQPSYESQTQTNIFDDKTKEKAQEFAKERIDGLISMLDKLKKSLGEVDQNQNEKRI